MITSNIKTIILISAFTMVAAILMADCKLLALIGLNEHHLASQTTSSSWVDFTDPCLTKLKSQGSNIPPAPPETYSPDYNPNGWGLVTYNGSSTTISGDWRAAGPAATSQAYIDAKDAIFQMQPRIILGHVRNASNLPNIIDPHPFRFMFGGREYSFIHNGRVETSHIEGLINTADPNWLITHPATQHSGQYVDSELYFLWIMFNIHQQNGNVIQALKNALSPVHTHATQNPSYADLNFILSDGMDIYAYRYCNDTTHPLAYFYDTTEESRNHYYSGVMTIFPTELAPSTITHQLDNNELVYLSSTGNVVRLPEFVASNNWYAQKIGFHKGVNWTGFPILNTDIIVRTMFGYFTNPTNGGITLIDAWGENDVTYGHGTTGWSDESYQLNQTNLFKITFTNDSPSIHTWSTSYYPISYATLIEPDIPLINGVNANQEYWLAYTLMPSQNIREAFGSSWANVKSVRAENWFYQIPPVDPKSGTNEPVPLYSWTTTGKNMDFGKGYIVTFKNNQDSFSWNRSYAPVVPTPGKEKAVNFTWIDKPDYVVVDIVEADNQSDIKEIGAFQGEECIGAVKTDTLPCQILIYPDYENPSPVTFSIVYKSKARPLSLPNYQVYDHYAYAYSNDQIIPVKDGLYQVKLTEAETGSGVVISKTLKSLSNYPNPFNPETNISFSLNATANVNVAIYNVKGQLVKSFGRETYQAGNHKINWNGKDDSNNPLGSGLFFIRIDSGTESITHKMIMLK